MDFLKEPRFWISIAIIAGATVLVALSKFAPELWQGLVLGLLLRFGADKATPNVVRALIPLALVGALLSGCICSTPRACLVTAQKAAAMADGPALKLIGEKCMSEATKCGPVGSAQCPGWAKCDKARAAYKAALDGLGGGLATCNRVLYDLGVK